MKISSKKVANHFDHLIVVSIAKKRRRNEQNMTNVILPNTDQNKAPKVNQPCPSTNGGPFETKRFSQFVSGREWTARGKSIFINY